MSAGAEVRITVRSCTFAAGLGAPLPTGTGDAVTRVVGELTWYPADEYEPESIWDLRLDLFGVDLNKDGSVSKRSKEHPIRPVLTTDKWGNAVPNAEEVVSVLGRIVSEVLTGEGVPVAEVAQANGSARPVLERLLTEVTK